MFSLKKNLKFITIDQKYLKTLHDSCSEVYYKPSGYESKPYIGILLEDNGIDSFCHGLEENDTNKDGALF